MGQLMFGSNRMDRMDRSDFLGRVAALIPRPRVNTIRFHGVYAAHARLRSAVVPARREDEKPCPGWPGTHDAAARRVWRLPWAELLARVFQVDVFRCPKCSAAHSGPRSSGGWLRPKGIGAMTQPRASGSPGALASATR